MVHIFIWDQNIQEYVCIKERATQEYLRNLMADPVWVEHDFCYIGW